MNDPLLHPSSDMITPLTTTTTFVACVPTFMWFTVFFGRSRPTSVKQCVSPASPNFSLLGVVESTSLGMPDHLDT